MVADAELDTGRGWVVVGLAIVMLLLVWGTIFTFTVYAGALATAFGLSPLRVSGLFSVTTAAFFVAGGLVGVVIARLPLRPVVAAVGIAFAAAIALLQVVSSYVGLVVAFALLGTAGGTCFLVVVSLVPQWFDVYEGRAMGIAMTGNGLGVFVLSLVWVWLLARVDVRAAFALVGGVTSAVILLSSRWYRRPAGLEPGRATGQGVLDRAWLRARLADRRFLVALVGYPLIWGWYFVLSSSLVDVLTTAGFATAVAATAFAIVGGVSVLARLGSGVVADRVGPRATLFGGVVLAGLGAAVLIVTDTRPVAYLTLAVFGVGLGVIATLFSPILVDRFGAADATAVVGIFNVAEATAAFGAPLGMRFLVDVTGGYAVPLGLLSLATLAGAGLFFWGTGRPTASTARG